MTVYLIYRIFDEEELERFEALGAKEMYTPYDIQDGRFLRAWTSKRKAAKKYLSYRNRHKMELIEVEMDEEEFHDFQKSPEDSDVTNESKEIQYYEFKDTRNGAILEIAATPLEMDAVDQYYFDRVEGDIYTILGDFIPAQCFKPKYRKALDLLGISNKTIYANPDMVPEEYIDLVQGEEQWDLGACGNRQARTSQNELNIFIEIYIDEMKVKK